MQLTRLAYLIKNSIKRKKYKDPDGWHEGFIQVLSEIIKPKISIEIGVGTGVVTKILAEYSESVIAIDIDRQAVDNVQDVSNLSFINSNSHDALKNLIKLNIEAELIFIDGDHNADVVMQDFMLSTKLISPSGIIIIHDTYPRNLSFTTTDTCADSYLIPDRIKNLPQDFNIITIPVHPGLTIIQCHVSRPDWIL